jgi:hypothetical protein
VIVHAQRAHIDVLANAVGAEEEAERIGTTFGDDGPVNFALPNYQKLKFCA